MGNSAPPEAKGPLRKVPKKVLPLMKSGRYCRAMNSTGPKMFHPALTRSGGARSSPRTGCG